MIITVIDKVQWQWPESLENISVSRGSCDVGCSDHYSHAQQPRSQSRETEFSRRQDIYTTATLFGPPILYIPVTVFPP